MKFVTWAFLALQTVALLLSPLALAKDSSNIKGAPWEYDPAPNPEIPMQRELIDILAEMPYMPGISEELTGEQKFRKIFGPVFWRMLLEPDSVVILFEGQDATHIAEASRRTATAGFGGRGQDLANYLGIDRGAAFINAYAYTIYGQAAYRDTPYVVTGKDGKAEVRFTSFVNNQLWMMTYDQRSAITKWRNRLTDWIIRNNRNSLRLIVAFGGAARNGIGSFIVGSGGSVGSYLSPELIKNVRVPMIDPVSGGGNDQFPVLLNNKGEDLYSALAGRRLNYKDDKDKDLVGEMLQITKEQREKLSPAELAEAQRKVDANVARVVREGAFSGGGLNGSGIIHPAQLGGYDFDLINIRGRNTRNIKDLILSDGKPVGRDVVVAEFPHPTALSMMDKASAARAVAKGIAEIAEYAKKIPAEEGFTNKFAAGIPYEYGRASIGPMFYSFGTPLSRQVSVSSAVRMHGKPNVIIFGSRDEVDFGDATIAAATKAKPNQAINPGEIFANRPRLPESRYIYDRGPGAEWARLMEQNIDLEAIFKTKPGKTWQRDGLDAYNVKTTPDHGDFGHYRGTFENPRVLVLADPDGVDDMITSRALTGNRGQYLQGLMNDLGVDDQYLILKTVPFGMDGATEAEWAAVLKQTQTYRDQVIGALLEKKFDAIVTDGEWAALEMERLTKGLNVEVVNINRQGLANDSGIVEAGKVLAAKPAFKGAKISGRRANIPRSHLDFYAPMWQGTSGDSVFYATEKLRGCAFALVEPEWAYRQKVELDAVTQRIVREQLSEVQKLELPPLNQPAREFLEKGGIKKKFRQAN